MIGSFRFEPLGSAPIIDLAPLSSRMVSAWRDRRGRLQVVGDCIDVTRDGPFSDLSSWDASLQHHVVEGDGGRRFGGVVAARSLDPNAPDAIGAASPGVAVLPDRVVVCYAARGPRLADQAYEPRDALAGEPGAMLGRILIAEAPLDADGAPCGPFTKRGTAVDLGPGWRSTRLDDPCPAVVDGRVVLWFKAIGHGAAGFPGNRVLGRAEFTGDEWRVDPEPSLVVPGGLEMPRVFRHAGAWHAFLKRFRPEAWAWEHWVLADGGRWQRRNERLFAGAGPEPGAGAHDMCPIWEPYGEADAPPREALAAGLDADGLLKQWRYRIEPT